MHIFQSDLFLTMSLLSGLSLGVLDVFHLDKHIFQSDQYLTMSLLSGLSLGVLVVFHLGMGTGNLFKVDKAIMALKILQNQS